MTQRKTVGFIGLGAMGGPMAANLVRAGFAVQGYDVAVDRLKALSEAGGAGEASPAEAARGARILVVMVATAAQADAVLFGDEGATTTLPAGATVILNSTVPPAYVRRLGERLGEGGHLLLDAPVSGGRVGAEAGSLTIMAAGSPEAFAAAEPVLDVVGGKVYRLGDTPGAGSTVKMLNQLLAGIHIVSAAEAMALGTRVGIDPTLLYEIISVSAGGSWMFKDRVPRMLERGGPPASALEIFVKDLGIVLDSARDLRFPLPLTATAYQQFIAAAAAGHGLEDDSAVIAVYEALAGIDVEMAAANAKDE